MKKILQKEGLDVRDGLILKYNAIPYMVFKYYNDTEVSLLTYMQAYGDKLYIIRLIATVIENDKENYIIDYKILESIVEM